MDFIKKYWLVILIIILLGIYIIYKNKIDKYIGIIKSAVAPSWASCNTTFFAKLPDGKFLSVFKADEGTTDNPVPVYFKRPVTLVDSGISESGESIKITKEEYDGFCKYFYNPPYEWYTSEYAQQPTGHRTPLNNKK